MQGSTILYLSSDDEQVGAAIMTELAQIGRVVRWRCPRGNWSAPDVARLVRECRELDALALVGCPPPRAAALAAWLCGVPVCFDWSKANAAESKAALQKELLAASPQTGLPLLVKRGFDVLVAGMALAAAAPLLGASAAVLRLTLGAPVLFRQARPGKGGKLFHIYKFRTMTNERDASGALLPDEQRLVGAGRVIRRLSLDELPQLVNVLLGEMSLVGPRPLLTQYLERYSTRQKRRHNVLPGITGLAQINGRNATSWPERFEHDLKYVDEWSLSLDGAILLKTLGTVLGGRGVSQAGHATMPEFRGDES